MPSILSSELKPREFTDPDRLVTTVDFKIDGQSLHETLLAANQPFTPESSLPGFVGLDRDDGLHWKTLLEGYNSRVSIASSNLAPLMGCGDCGSPYCGGVWTRIFVGEHHVNWSGFVFWDGYDAHTPNPVYLDQLFVFERGPYERLFKSLIEESRASC